ncbi:hypothetical protein [Burkholderia diffusa]|uniref:hypothetical protein n=1 Tax=Burkholderia diffusa TaxID=488732 RepID=UPI00158A22ED|nr:hypothetical protein [Burkholderia diffusa]
MTQHQVPPTSILLDLLRQEQSDPFIEASKATPTPLPQASDEDMYAALRREFDTDMYERISLKRIATLSR